MTFEDVDTVQGMIQSWLKAEREAGSRTLADDATLAQWMRTVGGLLVGSLPGAVLVCDEGEEVAGMTMFVTGPVGQPNDWQRAATSLLTFVQPAHRRKGVALELLAHRDRLAHQAGCDGTLTLTRVDNAETIALLKRAGYLPRTVVWERRLP